MKKYPKYKKYRGGNSPRFSSHDLILWLLNAWRRKKIGSVFSSFCLWENQNFSGKFYFLKKPTFNGCLCECFLTFSLLFVVWHCSLFVLLLCFELSSKVENFVNLLTDVTWNSRSLGHGFCTKWRKFNCLLWLWNL